MVVSIPIYIALHCIALRRIGLHCIAWQDTPIPPDAKRFTFMLVIAVHGSGTLTGADSSNFPEHDTYIHAYIHTISVESNDHQHT